MHSHAVAPESSGAFFLDMGTERCVFQAGGLRNALRASEAVRATDVMVNSSTPGMKSNGTETYVS